MTSSDGDSQAADEAVWYLGVYQTVENIFGFRSDLFETDVDAFRNLYRRFKRGKLPLDEMPDRLWMMAVSPSARRKTLRHFTIAGDFLVVSKDVAEVMRTFDLGRNLLKPVEMLKSDRKTPYPGEWFLLQMVERKEGYEPDLSQNVLPPMYPERDTFLGMIDLHRPDVACTVNRSTLEGGDAWVDPLLNVSFFVSDRLMAVLMARNLLTNLKWLRCAVTQ